MAKDKDQATPAKEGKKKQQSKKKNRIAKWFKELKIELGKVIWPTKKTALNNSIVVFATMLLCAAVIFLLDEGFLWLFKFAIGGGN